jgi:hypothetical protein
MTLYLLQTPVDFWHLHPLTERVKIAFLPQRQFLLARRVHADAWAGDGCPSGSSYVLSLLLLFWNCLFNEPGADFRA